MTVTVIRIISLPGQAGLVEVGLFVLGCGIGGGGRRGVDLAVRREAVDCPNVEIPSNDGSSTLEDNTLSHNCCLFAG